MIPGGAPVGGRLGLWLIDSSPTLESMQKDLKQVGQNIIHLTKILDSMSSMVAPVVDSEVILSVTLYYSSW